MALKSRLQTYRSLSSAAWEASSSLDVATFSLSSDLSRSSSISWIRRLRAATSPSAYGRMSLVLLLHIIRIVVIVVIVVVVLILMIGSAYQCSSKCWLQPMLTSIASLSMTALIHKHIHWWLETHFIAILRQMLYNAYEFSAAAIASVRRTPYESRVWNYRLTCHLLGVRHFAYSLIVRIKS